MTAKKISKKLSKELQNLENMGPDAHAVEVQKELDAEEKRKNALGRADERIKRSKVSSGTISMYLSEISQYEPLSPDREVELAVLIAKGDKKAMKELGRQFVLGETIQDALKHGEKQINAGYTFSYDMLGEAAPVSYTHLTLPTILLV